MTTDDNFAALVLGKVDVNRPFETQIYYDSDGDCIEFLASNEPFYAERMDSLVTVYYSEETNEVIGSLIKRVKSFIREVIQKVPGFKIEVRDGHIRLEHIFTAKMWYFKDDENQEQFVKIYQTLRDKAEECNAQAELCSV
jgi:hypothetical protein